MKSRWLVAAAMGAVAVVSATPAHAVDPVVFWNQILVQNVTGSPVLTSRTYSMVDVAVYEALNSTTGNTRRSYLGLGPTSGDTNAAIATAAFNVMSAILPAGPSAQRTAIQNAYNDTINAIPDSLAKNQGIAAGALAATTVINARTGDGSAAPAVPVYTPLNPPVDGHWQQTTAGAAGAPVTPWWGGVTPWGPHTGAAFRPGAPPDINSQAFTDALAVVREIGDLNSATRTTFQTQSAQFWATAAGTGLTPWILGAIGAADGRGLSSLDYASLFASLTTNVADSTIGIFDAKYTYDFWRPITAIHDADGNDLWKSLIAAPAHPSYISGHSAIAATAAETLAFYLGADTDICFAAFLGGTCFGSFADAAQNAANSRLWGGIHYDFDNQAGLTLGRQVAQFNLSAGLFQAVPEPGTWAMMLVGFGMIGWSMRRTRASARRQAAPSAA